jgi:hypothetical protein
MSCYTNNRRSTMIRKLELTRRMWSSSPERHLGPVPANTRTGGLNRLGLWSVEQSKM